MRRISAGQRQRQRTLAPLHRPAEGLLSRVPPLLASAHSLRERRWLGLGRPRRLRASATAVPGRPTGVFTGLSWSLHVRHRGLSVPRRELHPPARPLLYGHALRALLFALDLTRCVAGLWTTRRRSGCTSGASGASQGRPWQCTTTACCPPGCTVHLRPPRPARKHASPSERRGPASFSRVTPVKRLQVRTNAIKT